MQFVDTLRAKLGAIKQQLAAVPGLPEMFEQCFLNTVETTVKVHEDGNVFVITGDIPAMWLRDSSAQVMHYLRFHKEPQVQQLVEGLLKQQVACILHDPYANAFNEYPLDQDNGDRPRVSPLVWEQKYEIDSLCYPIWLAAHWYERSGRMDWLDADFHRAMEEIVTLFEREQRHDSQSRYFFLRKDCPAQDTLSHAGHGAPTAYTGMTWSGFRPSDDACVYGYLVPSNLFAASILKEIVLFCALLEDSFLVERAKTLREQILLGVSCYGHAEDEQLGDILAYESDGMGNVVLMDDANVPSLLSLPYLGALSAEDPLYQRTRQFVLSSRNPYYAEGEHARGIGSPHTPPGYIWHIALCIQAMTSQDAAEQAELVKMLLTTHAGTGFMHEGFHPDDPAQFTRSWFAWANSLFGETIYRLYEAGTLPEVLKRSGVKAIETA